MKNKGFTLIELLVVIAIIGILSAIVLASLDTARNKGADAAVKSNLDNARAQAENFYDSNSTSYFGACSNNATGILPMMQGAQQAGGATAINTTYNVGGTASTVTCHDSTGGTLATGTGWAAEAPLKTDATKFWCVDSTGTSSVHSNHIQASAVVCLAG